MIPLDVIVPAGGLGLRVQGPCPKQFLLLGGLPLLVHPLRVLVALPYVRSIIVVYPLEHYECTRQIADTYFPGRLRLVAGGATRQESVFNGLQQVNTSRVLIHNAAVALATEKMMHQVAERDDPCVTTATALQLNVVAGEEFAESYVDRRRLRIISSPQSFSTDLLRQAHLDARQRGLRFDSDTELMLHYGHQVRLVEGGDRCLKITTEVDLAVAESLLRERPSPLPIAVAS